MRELLAEYRESKRGLIDMLANLKEREQSISYEEVENADELLRVIEDDRNKVNSMIASMNQIIQWIETGINPYYQQGVDARYAYDVTYKNMELIPDIYEQIKTEREELVLDDDQVEILRRIFSTLTERENDCMILHIGKNYSMSETGEMLGINKTTVQNHVERAKKKVDNIIKWYGEGTK